jgi:RNA polymerase sigma factor (sigma-70 family)
VQRLVGSKLRDFPRVQRWERQSDVFQNVMLTLHQKLGKIEFKDTRHFFRLSGVLVRRELVNLHRHHYGPQGHAAHHLTQGISPGGSDPSDATPAAAVERAAASDSSDPVEALQTLEVHQHVGRLPKDLREVVGLLYYHGLSPVEAADVMKVSRRTVDRLWDKARARLGRAIRG